MRARSEKGDKILRQMSRGLRDDLSIHINVDSKTGKITFKVGSDVVGSYQDAYEALADFNMEFR